MMSTLSVFGLILSFWNLVDIAQSQDINCTACGVNATCDVMFTDDGTIWGCGGSWTSQGIESAERLCADGFKICDNYHDAADLGLTLEMCTSRAPGNHFYASAEHSSGGAACADDGSDDVFGCATNATNNWIYISDAISCGPFGSLVSYLSGGAADYGWYLWDYDDQHEREVVRHPGSDFGGVLCCDIEAIANLTTDGPTCPACNETSATCDINFTDTIAGCGGKWRGEGIDTAQHLCAEGFEICSDGEVAERMGLSFEDCTSLPEVDHFYATAARSPGDAVCRGYGSNDVYGCASNTTNDWLYISENIDCGAFGAALSWYSGDAWMYGWWPWNKHEYDERDAVSHSAVGAALGGEVWGGVMCCNSTAAAAAVEPETTEVWPADGLEYDRHKCRTGNGCFSYYGGVKCDVEFVPNLVYGCSGVWADSSVMSGDWMCADGYQICSNYWEAEALNLTKEACASYPALNYFYASAQSTYDGYSCASDPSAGNNIYGCGLDDPENWMLTYSDLIDMGYNDRCGVFAALMTPSETDSALYGWAYSNDTAKWWNSKYWVTHSGKTGGVMCCRNFDESLASEGGSLWGARDGAFMTSRLCEIISLIGTTIVVIVSVIQIWRKEHYVPTNEQSSTGTSAKKKLRHRRKTNSLSAAIKFSSYAVYAVSIMQASWNVIVNWVLIREPDTALITCHGKQYGNNIFNMLYKITFYGFLLIKINRSLEGASVQYPKIVYISVGICVVIYATVVYGLWFGYCEQASFPSPIGGIDCYCQAENWLLWFGGSLDACLSAVCLYMFTHALQSIVKMVTMKKNPMKTLILKNTVLALIAILTSLLLNYVGYTTFLNELGWFSPLDPFINNLCIFFSFQFNQKLFYTLCCKWWIVICGCSCAEAYKEREVSRTSRTGSKTDSKTGSKRNMRLSNVSPRSPDRNGRMTFTTNDGHLSPRLAGGTVTALGTHFDQSEMEQTIDVSVGNELTMSGHNPTIEFERMASGSIATTTNPVEFTDNPSDSTDEPSITNTANTQ